MDLELVPTENQSVVAGLSVLQPTYKGRGLRIHKLIMANNF